MSSIPWSYHAALVQPSLVRDVELYAELQLPPANTSPPSNSIQRFVDDVHTGVMVTHDTRELCPSRTLMPPSDISYSNPGTNYQPSMSGYAESDSSSSGNHNSYSTLRSTGSPEEEGYPRQTFEVSPIYEYMSRRSDLDAPVDPNLAPSDTVCPKAVHISNGDDQGQEGHTDEEDEYRCPQTVPDIMYPFYEPRYYTYDQPPPIEAYSQQHDHSLNHDHSGSSAQCSRHNSPSRELKLKTQKHRRNKCPPGMMKPFAASPGEVEKTRKLRGEKPRGRGAGKKAKERKVCREHPAKVFNHASDYKKHMNQQHLRPFLCVFFFAGCTQTFGSKNEWKRHVNSQHLQLFYWHCDDSLCADRKAIFNRKDLFGQHLKRMHPPPAGSKSSAAAHMEAVIDRCRVERRQPPQHSRCGYCKQEFEGPQGWEQRMEHVGQHYEKNNYKEYSSDCWVPDEGLIKWALEHGIIEENNDGSYTIISTGKDAVVKAGVEQKKLAREEMAREYADDDLDFDAEGEDEYMHG
ncbi:hypothetical protein B9Z19DRAFT_1099323 [Tuber borchii]|uniref:C2H2-type domain-containing protein n=1 Tax=Tuber borchii TaxID=42251 RepID=A0A2T7A3E2_TUBBO|nr:hypothetical protein B9Z19DRAFT_1099323 [Tuber borchii]